MLAALVAAVLAVTLAVPISRGDSAQQQRPLRLRGQLWKSDPGALVVHTVLIENRGDADRVSLSAQPGAWAASVPASVEIAAGGLAAVPVTVTVPITAPTGSVDRVNVVVVSTRTGQVVTRTLVSSTSGDLRDDGYVGCRFDLDLDGVVGAPDVDLATSRFDAALPEPGYAAAVDLDHSGRVGIADVQAMATQLGTACASLPEADSAELRRVVGASGARSHLEQLQAIAEAHDGNRAVAKAGYDLSAQYVADSLRDAGYVVEEQQFTVAIHGELEPAELQRIQPSPRQYTSADFAVFEYSGSGDVTAEMQAVDLVLPPGPQADASTSGCEATDFGGFKAGGIALLQRGGCGFRTKVANAETAGAVGVILFNEGQPGRQGLLVSSLGGPGIGIPAFGTTFQVGDELAGLVRGAGAVRVRMFAKMGVVEHPTTNVIVDSPTGDPRRVVVLGAHLDSTPNGPGMNDNGSGSAVVLEIALGMAKLGIEPRNKVRFAFWGAEERGLLGSDHYVRQLDQGARDDIMLYLNFDMVGSPNFVRFVYDGHRMSAPGGAHPGSEEIEAVFARHFQAQGLAIERAALGGRSDQRSFARAGIPAGGLFTGAESIKTAAQAAVFGGAADAPLDPCYHKSCDTVDNVSWEVLEQMIDAAADATLAYVMDGRSVLARPHGGLPPGVLEGRGTSVYQGLLEAR